MLVKRMLCVFSLCLPLTAFAEWQGPFSVGLIEAGETAVYFYKADGFPNPAGCGNPQWIVYDTPNMVKHALSVGLAAQASGKKIKHHIVGCTPHIRSTHIQIIPD